jgi:hypothetical protein
MRGKTALCGSEEGAPCVGKSGAKSWQALSRPFPMTKPQKAGKPAVQTKATGGPTTTQLVTHRGALRSSRQPLP